MSTVLEMQAQLIAIYKLPALRIREYCDLTSSIVNFLG